MNHTGSIAIIVGQRLVGTNLKPTELKLPSMIIEFNSGWAERRMVL